MTGDKIALRAQLDKGSDTPFRREMIGFAERILVSAGDQSPVRRRTQPTLARRAEQRNVYRDRD